MEKIRLVINGSATCYDRREFEKFYKDSLPEAENYPEDTLRFLADSAWLRLLENDGDPYGHMPEPVRKFLHEYRAFTGKAFVCYAGGELLEALAEALKGGFVKERGLYSSEKPVTDPKTIKTDEGVKKLIEHLGLTVTENKNAKNPHLLEFSQIVIPPKDRFYSASNYNHVLLHEAVHMIGWKNNLCGDLLKSYELNAGNPKDILAINAELISGKGGGLSTVQKNFAANYAIDEISVENTAFGLMKKLGITPDARDRADKNGYVLDNLRVLTAVEGPGLNRATVLKRYDKQAAALIKYAEKTCDKALGTKVRSIAPKSTDKGISM